jgi:hypothetical protein
MKKTLSALGILGIVLGSTGCNAGGGQAITPSNDQITKMRDSNPNISPEMKAKIDAEQAKGSERGRAAAARGANK